MSENEEKNKEELPLWKHPYFLYVIIHVGIIGVLALLILIAFQMGLAK